MQIPAHGMSREEVFNTLAEYRKTDPDWREGKIFGFVFHASEEATQVTEDAFRAFMWENMLDPTVFRSLLRMETEIVEMCSKHLGGDDEVVGSFTSGGTESCILAVKTAREWGEEMKGITQPEMIIPITAHAAFQKAAKYLKVKLLIAPVDPKTFKADVNWIRKAITKNTVLIVGSAVSFAHGVSDPIREMAALAQEHGILMHTDGCIGGFMLPLFKKLGGKTTDFDFSVPGVTSISMDLHKYAFAAKGASVVLYKNKELRRHQIFACSNWTGYTIVNPTIQSTKSGGPVAGAWATLNFIGQAGYLEIARQLREGTEKFKAGIAALPDFYVLGEPEISLVSVATDTLDIFEVCDEMLARGYHIQPQPGVDGLKENFHITIMPQNLPHMDALLGALKEVAGVVRGRTESEMVKQLKSMAGSMDASQLSPEGVTNLLAMAGLGTIGIPDKMAEINQILNSLPRDVADKLLTGFFNDLSRYRP